MKFRCGMSVNKVEKVNLVVRVHQPQHKFTTTIDMTTLCSSLNRWAKCKMKQNAHTHKKDWHPDIVASLIHDFMAKMHAKYSRVETIKMSEKHFIGYVDTREERPKMCQYTVFCYCCVKLLHLTTFLWTYVNLVYRFHAQLGQGLWSR